MTAIFGHPPSNLLLVSQFLLFICVILFLCFKKCSARGNPDGDEEKPPIRLVYRSIEQAKFILNGSCLQESTPENTLKARAGPNARLVHAFGIDNAFTSTDTKYHREFVSCAAGRINLSNSRWELLAKDIKILLSGNIERQRTSSGTVLLSRLLQITVLRAILPVLFPNSALPNLPEQEQDDIAYSIADKINSLWIESKTARQPSPEDLQLLMEGCRKLLPGISFNSPRESPLNLILPAFETLWRIVFRCFIEVQFRSKGEFEFNKLLLEEYLSRPTAEVFSRVDSRDISVYHIVNEALRLYPPTKRVYRHLQTGSEVKPDVVAVDIEYIHRDPEIWGTDATSYRPSRWSKGKINRDMLAAFFPFGMKPLICPAKRVFGPRIIGLLVASLSQTLNESGEWEIFEEGNGQVDGLLGNARDNYQSMEIRMKEKV